MSVQAFGYVKIKPIRREPGQEKGRALLARYFLALGVMGDETGGNFQLLFNLGLPGSFFGINTLFTVDLVSYAYSNLSGAEVWLGIEPWELFGGVPSNQWYFNSINNEPYAEGNDFINIKDVMFGISETDGSTSSISLYCSPNTNGEAFTGKVQGRLFDERYLDQHNLPILRA